MNINEDSIHKQKNDIDERIKRLEQKLKAKDKAYCQHKQNLKDNVHNKNDIEQIKQQKTSNEITSREKLQRALVNDFKQSQTLPLHEWNPNKYQKNSKDKSNKYISIDEKERTRKLSGYQHNNFNKSNSNEQLMEIMKNILEGQKKLQMEIKNIKNQYQHQQNTNQQRVFIHQPKSVDQTFQYRETFSCKPNQPIFCPEMNSQTQPRFSNIHSKQESKQSNKSPYFRPAIIKQNKKSSNKILKNLSKSKEEINHLIQYSDNTSPNKSAYQHRKRAASTKRATIRKQNKQAEELKFIEMMNMLRFQKDKKQRICIKAQLKTKVWQEVYKKLQQSEKQFKSSKKNVSRNFEQHLLSTIELQNKLKKQLLNKIYSHCNSYIYK